MTYNSFNQALPDKDNSTFRHVASTFGGQKIVGYSKKAGFNEGADKRRLFVSSMARLLPGFFSKRNDVWQLQVYRRLPERQNGLWKESLVATFTSSEFQLHNGFDNDKAIQVCMQAIYDGDIKGSVELLKNYNDFAFDPRTETYEGLVAKCTHLLNFHERGIVERFFFETKKRFFPATGQQPTPDQPAQPQPIPARTKQTSSLKDLLPQL